MTCCRFELITKKIAADSDSMRAESEEIELKSFAFDDRVDQLRAQNLEELERTEKANSV